jgi:D-arginine dehydrogenase
LGSVDVVVIGGGIAGASVAAELAVDRAVVLLEAEDQLAVHSTGRSAAMFLESYGGPIVRALTSASRALLTDPPDGFDRPLLRDRGLLWVADRGMLADLDALEAAVRPTVAGVVRLPAAEAVARFAALRPDWVAGALLEPDATEIDVAALHAGYVRRLRAAGGTVVLRAGAAALRHAAGTWAVTDAAGQIHRAPVVVNAAGAWCDEVAAMGGVRPLGLAPLRRTLFTVPAPPGCADLPLISDVAHTFYVKPEGGQLLCSPADEGTSRPGDVRPDELEIARALDRIAEVTTLAPRHVRTAWAGLRTFTADREPVAGFADDAPGFFWLAGQGGYGIQTAPALARAAAALLRDEPLPADLTARGLTPELLGPQRLRPTSPG